MTVVTPEEYIVTVEEVVSDATVTVVTDGAESIEILVDQPGQDEVLLTVESDPQTVEVPADEDVEIVVDGVEMFVEIDDVPSGPPGPPGPSGGASAAFTHTQVTPSTVWTIDHGLDYDPAGIVVVSDGYQIDGFVTQYTAPGQLRLSFDIPLAGTARLS